MKGKTNDYYQLFIQAKSSFVESDTKKEVKGDYSQYKIIYEEICRLLHDSEGMAIDSFQISKQLFIEEKLNSESSEIIKESLIVFLTIRDAVTDKIFGFNNKQAWLKAIHLVILYELYKEIQIDRDIPEEDRFIAHSLLHLKKIGFKIDCIDGNISAGDRELLRLCLAIEYRVKKLGKEGFLSFLNVIDKHFSRSDQRFYFYRRRPTLPTNQKPVPPHGYVFNLFCKTLNSSCKLKIRKQEQLLNEVQDLSTHLATILDLDKMSPWSNINVQPENIVNKLTEWVLYPEVFYIPQISPKHGKKIFPRIFELIDNNTEDCLKEIIKASRVMEKIEEYIYLKNSISGELSEELVYKICSEIDTPKNIQQILNSISKPADEINKGYVTPFDANKSNIREFPLIKTNYGYVVCNIATYNIAKYRALIRISEEYNPKTEQKLGIALEDFIKESFDQSHIDYHHSVKFTAPSFVRKITKSNRDQGECDFIVESNEYIYLIEVKKKGLTKNSQSGIQLDLLLDTTLSFLRSVNQLTIAELILLHEGKISYSNGDKEIDLNERRVFKLVVSLEDMATLQCDNIKTSLLSALYNTNISVDVIDDSISKSVDKINNTLSEFTLLHNDLMLFSDKYKNTPFHDISYLSTPQLLTLLDDVNNNEEFSDSLSRSNTVVYSLMDWYASYKLSQSNSKLNQRFKNVLKKSILLN